jgi:hypothetical protein
MARKKKETTVNIPERPEIQYEYYEAGADLVIHCSKCNQLTPIIIPNNIQKALDLTAIIGGPMPTDNQSAFPLYCDHCKVALTLRMIPHQEQTAIEAEKIMAMREGRVVPEDAKVVEDEPQVSNEIMSSPEDEVQTESVE